MIEVKEELVIELPKFITHIQQSKNKWIKIGYNKLYTGVHYSVRSKLIDQMHQFILPFIPDNVQISTPVETYLQVHAPINYSRVMMLKRKATGERYLNWKPPSDNYEADWDIDNLVVAWVKAMNDCMEKKGIIPADSVQYLSKKGEEFVPCDHIDDRKLVFTIKERK